MGGKQLGFSDYEQTTAKKQTKREKFLAEMEAVVPWDALIALIEPHYPKIGKKGGRPPYPLATMLRIPLLQPWYSLSDPAMEEAPDRSADHAPLCGYRPDQRPDP
jgi:transposase, IS5 family